MAEEGNNFAIFEDRVKSLLERWRLFLERHPEVPPYEVVKSCMLEIDDGYTKKLMEP